MNYVVTNNGDGSPITVPGTLRWAIFNANANPGSTITFAVVGTISLTDGELQISASMDINGPGADILNIQRTSATNFIIFNIVNDITFNINNLTISNGNASNFGGGIFNATNTILTINMCEFVNNTASDGGAVASGPSRIFNSTFRNNTATNRGGGVYQASDNLIINCTFDSNTSNNSLGGSAIFVFGSSVNTVCTVINTSVYNNLTSPILVFSTTASSLLTIGNTVVARNPAGAPDFKLTGPSSSITSLGYNFIGNADGTTAFVQPGDQAGTTLNPLDPLLLPLGYYGGKTQTTYPLPNSPLIDAGNNNIVSTYFVYPQVLYNEIPIDQRGFFRIINTVDIGSVEFDSRAVCYSGDSIILTKNIQTDKIENIKASELLSHLHHVFCISENQFIPVKYNIVTGNINRFIKIEKDALGENKPSETFYVTTGHKLLIDGKEIKSKKIPQGKRIKVKPQKVYSIVTEKRVPILVNNLAVMTHGLDEWINYSKQRGIGWYDNKL